MKLFSLSASVFALLCSFSAVAAEPFTGEAEAGAVVVSGNSDSQSYAAKGKAVYTHEKNVYTAFGRYLKTDSNGVESARNWEAGARYERELTDYLGVFAGQKAESDVFNGYVQRDSTDLGLKYSLIKSDEMNWFFEVGYRYQKTLSTAGTVANDNMGRVYTEFNKALDKTLSFKYWAEYLPNFTEPDAYLFNTEASLNVMLNSIFSLKLAYLLQYQNEVPASGKYTTTTTTMNLVAKF
ncbi:DUF481 domain-containing protein [Bdellovibrio bacteriovorus]|uniref:DUF481 domain-containing protein n=1 Tax=Bdellovibrio bacteriovorus TaxID=959 RepID=UPI0021D3D560|nr:DUF481 domain-containing protein [Bdellovibrio bacteriovorus]UXR65592.1 DUF481 domain-containing protein [Bdellovibrio bacteriovorus]